MGRKSFSPCGAAAIKIRPSAFDNSPGWHGLANKTVNTSLSSSTLIWARTTMDLNPAELASEIGATVEEVEHWEATGEIDLDLVPKFAETAKLPFGYFFLPEPPSNQLNISDFRRVAGEEPPPPSRRLLSVLYRCQRRQRWYREYQINNGAPALPFVGSKTIKASIVEVAKEIASTVQIGAQYNRIAETWEDTMTRSIENIESAGIIVSKVSFSDDYTHNTLPVSEFRGFALSDPYAPLVFVNSADAPSAQMFTLAHEIVHIWLGESAVSNLDRTYAGANEIERFCNAVAAEVLVPLGLLKAAWNNARPTDAEVTRLSRQFRVSKVVIARRANDGGLVSKSYYDKVYETQMAAAAAAKAAIDWGNYYTTKPYEASRRFSAAIIADTRDGRTMYREAMSLLGIRTSDGLAKYAQNLQMTL
jgi:Zn-dependent peptidase ImmA (M78 family)